MRSRMEHGWAACLAGLAFLLAAVPADAQTSQGRLKNPSLLSERSPDSCRARFETSQGAFVVAVQREWLPLAADRFYNLVKNGFYDGTRFFRVLDGFMAQFGLNGDPAIQSVWQTANLRDEPARQINLRGWDGDGFAPFGQVVSGMDVVDRLYSGYGRQNMPDQRQIVREGNAYLDRDCPRLDFVKTATVEP